MVILVVIIMLLNPGNAASQVLLRPLRDSFARAPLPRVLPQNFYNKHLGFFCKKEVQLQKKLTLPVYFRLGSKRYTDYMEKKPNAAGAF
jgi:hypothetical protein